MEKRPVAKYNFKTLLIENVIKFVFDNIGNCRLKTKLQIFAVR